VGSAAGGGVAADFAVSHPDRLLSLVINSNPAGLSGGDIVKTYERLRPKGFEGMPADFRELGRPTAPPIRPALRHGSNWSTRR